VVFQVNTHWLKEKGRKEKGSRLNKAEILKFDSHSRSHVGGGGGGREEGRKMISNSWRRLTRIGKRRQIRREKG